MEREHRNKALMSIFKYESVVSVVLCPSASEITGIEVPFSNIRDAKLCLKL